MNSKGVKNKISVFAVLAGVQLFGLSAHAQIQPLPDSSLAPVPPPPEAAAPVPSAPVPSAQSAAPAPPVPTMRHAPRVGSIALGWTYSPISYLPLSADIVGGKYRTQGLRVDGKFGWQVGGFTSGYSSYVGFMAGFYYFFGGSVADSLGLDYGVFAKHVIVPGQRVRGFLSYGLGATQVWVRQLEGRGIGHVTRLSGGIDVKLKEQLRLELEVAYQFNILATFASAQDQTSRSYDFHTVNMTAGLWFGK